MGLGKWLARKGNIGGTTKFVINAYRSALENGSFNEDNCETVSGFRDELLKIVNIALDARFFSDPNNPHRKQILEEYESNHGPGLAGFVISILVVEAGWNKNTPEVQEMFSEIILEDLKKAKIREDIIEGIHASTSQAYNKRY